MPYKENPKTKGSGILCCIPQAGRCPNKCPECFFQNRRSYPEPLEANLPNMPTPEQARGHVIRVNDGNDSNVDKAQVLLQTECYRDKFYNTAVPDLDFLGVVSRAYCDGSVDEAKRQMPVVLTINSGHRGMDERFYTLGDCSMGSYLCSVPPPNLMFVRILTNTWNQDLVTRAVRYWTDWEVPVVLTFMAYHKEPGDNHGKDWIGEEWTSPGPRPLCAEQLGYAECKRTLNTYWAVTIKAWREIMATFQDNKFVYSCGKIEGERGDTHCRFCGNCLREYYVTKARMGL